MNQLESDIASVIRNHNTTRFYDAFTDEAIYGPPEDERLAQKIIVRLKSLGYKIEKED